MRACANGVGSRCEGRREGVSACACWWSMGLSTISESLLFSSRLPVLFSSSYFTFHLHSRFLRPVLRLKPPLLTPHERTDRFKFRSPLNQGHISRPHMQILYFLEKLLHLSSPTTTAPLLPGEFLNLLEARSCAHETARLLRRGSRPIPRSPRQFSLKTQETHDPPSQPQNTSPIPSYPRLHPPLASWTLPPCTESLPKLTDPLSSVRPLWKHAGKIVVFKWTEKSDYYVTLWEPEFVLSSGG